jgi:hypothetical protein
MNNSDFSYSANKGDRFASVSSSSNGGSNGSSNSNVWKSNNYSSNSNSNRFASIGSEYNSGDDQTDKNSGYMSSFKYYLGTALYKTYDVACNIKEKVSEMELGSTLKGAGIKTVEIIKDTGAKVKESNAMQSVSKKAYQGFSYLSSKVIIVIN